MANKITRRDFLKGSAAGAAALTLTGLGLSAKSYAEAAEAKLFKPGTYSSVQSTDYAKIKVICEVAPAGVTDVKYELLESGADDYFALMSSAAEDYCRRIAEAGAPLEVDGISGASMCTTAIQKGVNECLAQALGVEVGKAGAAVINPQELNFTNTITDFSKSALFSDWQLGPHTIHNRMVKTSALNWNFSRHNPDEYIGFYKRMAEGGVEMIWVEDFADTWNRFKGGNNPMENYDIQGLLDALHGAGAKVGYQFGTMVCAVGPMDYTAPFIGEYSTEEVKEWIEEISDCALKLKEYGFDAYELNMAANNLGSSFFSRYRNNRTDEYGPQTIESRTRFARELIGAIKEKCGKDFVVQCLINGVEENDKMVGQNDGYNTVEEAAAIAKELEAAGADSLHIRIGPCYEHISQFAGDLYFAARGLEGYNSLGTRLDFDRQFQGLVRGNNSGLGLTLDIAAKIKEAVSIPVGCATYNDPAMAPDFFNSYIADGKIDFLMMNRPLCVDPEYVNKLREGRIDEIAPCTRCLHCFFDTPFDRCNMEHCRVNAAYFRAYSDSMPEGYYPLPAETPKKVMVIGGGPGGMEAARIAAQRGHSVKLFEKGASLGGMLGFAEGIKGPHENLSRLRAYLARQCELKGVEVVLNTEVTKELIESEAPDAIILAAGGKRAGSGLSSNGATKVMSIEDVLGGGVGENVVILGSGAQAVDTAILLLGQGKKVTLVAAEDKAHFEYGHSAYMKGFLSTAFYSAGGRLFPGATVKSVGDGFLSFTAESGIEYEYPCDTVIEALDMLPNTELIEGLDNAVAIGDCERPFNIAYAIATGNMAARKI